MSARSSDADDWAPEWVARKLSDGEAIASAAVGTGRSVAIERVDLPPVRVACVSTDVLTADLVEEVLDDDPEVSFIVNVSSGGEASGQAVALADGRGAAIGGMSDLRSALRLVDPATFVSSDREFVERGLRQHTAVAKASFDEFGNYRVEKKSGEVVVISVNHDYEMTADRVRRSIDAAGHLDAVVTANPYARPISQEATSAGESAGVRVLRWKDFYGQLNGSWT